MNGIHEVVGSNPIGSTTPLAVNPDSACSRGKIILFSPFCHCVASMRRPVCPRVQAKVPAEGSEPRAKRLLEKNPVVPAGGPLREPGDYWPHVAGLGGRAVFF